MALTGGDGRFYDSIYFKCNLGLVAIKGLYSRRIDGR